MKFAWMTACLIVAMTGQSVTLADTGAKVASFDSAGVKVAYIKAGEGEPVILIHGLYSSAAMNWKMPGIFDALAKHHLVVALDLRGHGRSDKPADEASYGQPMVDDVLRLMDHLKIEKAHIVGYSLGGIVAMKFIIDHPGRVLTGTLGGMGWLKKGSVEATMFERLGRRPADEREGGPTDLAGSTNTGGTPPACVHGIARLAVTQEQVQAVKIPLHILVGSRDPCRLMYVEPLKTIMPAIPVTVIDGAGHITCIIKPEFKEDLVKWIDQHKTADGADAGAATKPVPDGKAQ